MSPDHTQKLSLLRVLPLLLPRSSSENCDYCHRNPTMQRIASIRPPPPPPPAGRILPNIWPRAKPGCPLGRHTKQHAGLGLWGFRVLLLGLLA